MGFGNLIQVLWKDYKKKKNINVNIWEVDRKKTIKKQIKFLILFFKVVFIDMHTLFVKI